MVSKLCTYSHCNHLVRLENIVVSIEEQHAKLAGQLIETLHQEKSLKQMKSSVLPERFWN